MRRNYRLISTLLLCVPYVCVVLLLNRLPERLSIHLDEAGQPDHFMPRKAWFSLLTNVMLALLVGRTVLIGLLNQRSHLSSVRFVRVYLLSATLVGSVPVWFILWTLHPSVQLLSMLPVLVMVCVAGAVYLRKPAELPMNKDQTNLNAANRQLIRLNELQSLSRLVIIRVNLLVAGLLLFIPVDDRWAAAISANLLAFIGLFIIRTIRS